MWPHAVLGSMKKHNKINYTEHEARNAYLQAVLYPVGAGHLRVEHFWTRHIYLAQSLVVPA